MNKDILKSVKKISDTTYLEPQQKPDDLDINVKKMFDNSKD